MLELNPKALSLCVSVTEVTTDVFFPEFKVYSLLRTCKNVVPSEPSDSLVSSGETALNEDAASYCYTSYICRYFFIFLFQSWG